MKSKTIALLAIFALLLSAAESQAVRKAGLNGAAFLKIGVGARMVGLGSAVTTLHGDPNMVFWNPAGIATPEGKTQLSFTHNKWLLGLNHEAGAITRHVSGWGTFGIGIIYMGLSDIAADRDKGFGDLQIDEANDAVYGYNDMAVTLAYSRHFTDKLSLGVSGKFIRESIDDQSATAVAADFGVIYQTGFRDLTLGARLNNLGSDLKFYSIGNPIPLNFSIGASMSLAKEDNTQFVAFFDATKPQDAEQLFYSGGEWRVGDSFMLRGGYKLNFSNTMDAAGIETTDEGFSAGGGFKYAVGGNDLIVDYAFSDFSILSDTHRFTLRFEF